MKKFIIILIAIGLVIAVGAYFVVRYLSRESGKFANVFVVNRGDVTEMVSVTGKIKAQDSVELAFEKGGRIARVLVKEGDRVVVGQKLVELDAAEIVAQLSEARANLVAEEARLAELKSGTRLEELAVNEVELKKAEQDLANYYTGIATFLNDIFVKADNAANLKTDLLFTDDLTTSPRLSFMTVLQAETDAEYFRQVVTSLLANWSQEINGLGANSTQTFLDKALVNSSAYLQTISDFLIKCIVAIDKSVNLSAATAQTYRDGVNFGRSAVGTALSDVKSKEQAIASQKVVVEKAKQELVLKKAGSAKEKIDAQAARVQQAEANVALIESQFQKTILSSPLKGVITKQSAKVGEIVAGNVIITAIISDENFEVEANIPEADIAKVKVDNFARVTLDAYGSDIIFEAKVVAIGPAETMIEGVPTYKVTLRFGTKDARLKSGMTANLDIITAEKYKVLVVPQRLVVTKSAGKFVNLVSGKSVAQKEVTVGVRGSDGNIEILSGLNEGDRLFLGGSE